MKTAESSEERFCHCEIMLPHNHFIAADLAITAAAAVFYPQMSALKLGGWILAGGLASAAIDLDMITLVFFKSKKDGRLKPYRNPLKNFGDFEQFMKTLTETGLLKIGVVTHFLLAILMSLFFYYFYNSLFIPVLLGIASHLITDLITDMPNLRHIFNINKLT